MKRQTSPKWPDLQSVDIATCPVTKGRKGLKNSSREIAHKPTASVHLLSTGEDGESKHWLRQFAFEGGTEFVHGPSYHTRNAKGIVAYAQFASMLPVEEYGKLIGKAIEDGVIDLPAHTIQFLLSTKT